jgi:regulator of sirC expression with transglutaminase-like and TPR domain
VARRPEAELDLGLAALLLARLEHPGLDPAPWLLRLDDLAARSGAGREPDARRTVERLSAFLFEKEGFRGNAEDYYDPRNSCLNDVLERRLGIPITLSVVTLEVARRLGLELAGIGLPGHFVVGARVGEAVVVLDPFAGGRILDRQDAEALVSRAVGRRVTLTDAHFARATKAQIVARMLRNLKGIYAKRRDWEKTLAVIDGILTVEPGDQAQRSERDTVVVHLRRKLALLN